MFTGKKAGVIVKEKDTEEKVLLEGKRLNMVYRKVYRTDDEAAMNKIVKLLHRKQIPVYGKSEGAGEFLQISMGMSYQGRAIYVPEEYAEEAKKQIAEWEKKGELPEELRTRSHSLKARISAVLWIVLLVGGLVFTTLWNIFQ